MPRITRLGWLWISFGSLLVIALSAVGALSVTVWRLDQAEAAARRAAAIEENLRLALWRMDSALTPFLAQENARPAIGYLDTDAVADSMSHLFADDVPADPGQSQPNDDWVLLRFQLPLADGPMALVGQGDDFRASWKDPREARGDRPRTETSNLSDSLKSMDRKGLWDRLPHVAPSALAGQWTESPGEDALAVRSRAATEFSQRSRALALNNSMVQQLNYAGAAVSHQPPSLLVPIWQSGQMLLVRRLEARGKQSIQGCILNWDGLQRGLLRLSNDLLPSARLEPVARVLPKGEPGLMAALPVRLVPGELPGDSIPSHSPVWPTLLLAWSGVLTAALAGGLLLQGVVSLSQRRASFVSAVTHELRTPLTTFQMYTEMLAKDMVTDPSTRREYLETLHTESLRLSHMVENVLEFARLERGRGKTRMESRCLESMLSRCLPRLEKLVTDAGMRLVIEENPAWNSSVQVDELLVEQILRNLVDNACKYGVPSSESRIEFRVTLSGPWVQWRVRDFGPGLSSPGNWYHPFSKSAKEAAHSAPGIGLGLALSRRLARQMGTTLELDRKVKPGACFVLALRRSGDEASPM